MIIFRYRHSPVRPRVRAIVALERLEGSSVRDPRADQAYRDEDGQAEEKQAEAHVSLETGGSYTVRFSPPTGF